MATALSTGVRAQLVERQPTGRLGTATDTAHLVRFLVSEPGRWINGRLRHSNGGLPTGRLPV